MKTIGDIERWLKGAGDSVTLTYGPLRKVFYVEARGVKQESTTLEGAFDNLLEELRRKDNGAESMRTEKTASPRTAVTAQQYAAALRGIQPVSGAVGPQNPPSIATPTVHKILPCPQCGLKPIGMDKSRLWVCPFNHTWSWGQLIVKDIYQLDTGNYYFDGFDSLGWARWTHVP